MRLAMVGPVYSSEDDAKAQAILTRSLAALRSTTDADGVAGCVVRDGRIAARAGYGSIAGEASAPMTADTTFEIASQTKLMTTMAILSLAADDRISLTTKLTDHVPRERFTDPDLADAVTIDHCLRHTAGFAHSTRHIGLKRPLHSTGLSMIGSKASSCLVSQDGPIQIHSVPGERAQYSNVGAALAAEVLERSQGRTYAEIVMDEVLRPLEMSRTSIGSPARPEAVRRRKGGGSFPIQVSTRWKGIAGPFRPSLTLDDLSPLTQVSIDKRTSPEPAFSDPLNFESPFSPLLERLSSRAMLQVGATSRLMGSSCYIRQEPSRE